MDSLPLNFDVIRSVTTVCFSNRKSTAFPAYVDRRYDGPSCEYETYHFEFITNHAYGEKAAVMVVWTEVDRDGCGVIKPKSLFDISRTVIFANKLPTEHLPEMIRVRCMRGAVIHTNGHTWFPTVCISCGITDKDGYGSGTVTNWID